MRNEAAPVIQKEVLRDKIFALLKEWILDGTLKPGERIVEYVLAPRINVESRAAEGSPVAHQTLWELADNRHLPELLS